MSESSTPPPPGPVFPPGPALIYVPSDPDALLGDRDTTALRIDTGRPTAGGLWSEETARRERMLLRALLNQALWLLGPEEDEG